MQNWFVSWFNTNYYHILYKERDLTEAANFIQNIIHFLEIKDRTKVLDLACGKGRHSVILNQLNLDVLGVDLSENSICEAKKYENETLNFKVHDMRNPLDGFQFECVFNLFTSLGYFDSNEENIKMFQSIDSYTQKGGYFIIDFMNSEKVIQTLRKKETKIIDQIEFKISKEIINGYIIKKIEFKDKGKLFSFEEKVQVISLNDFENLFKETNFKIKNIFGDYNLSKFDVNNSDRLIIFAKK